MRRTNRYTDLACQWIDVILRYQLLVPFMAYCCVLEHFHIVDLLYSSPLVMIRKYTLTNVESGHHLGRY